MSPVACAHALRLGFAFALPMLPYSGHTCPHPPPCPPVHPPGVGGTITFSTTKKWHSWIWVAQTLFPPGNDANFIRSTKEPALVSSAERMFVMSDSPRLCSPLPFSFEGTDLGNGGTLHATRPTGALESRPDVHQECRIHPVIWSVVWRVHVATMPRPLPGHTRRVACKPIVINLGPLVPHQR